MTDFKTHDLSVSNEGTETDMLSWADKKFGPVCKKCGKRHSFLSTPGENLPKNRYNCDGK